MKLLLGCDAMGYPLTGISRYTRELALGLARCGEIQQLNYVIGRSVRSALPDPQAMGGSLPAARPGRAVAISLLKNKMLNRLYQQFREHQQQQVLRPFADFVYHGPNYTLPPHHGPCVTTFHDLSIVRYPQFHPAERVRYMKRALQLAIQRAHVVLTDCEFIRQEVIAWSGFSPARVLAVPLAASAAFRPRDEEPCRALMQHTGLNYGGFILFAGTIEPRKNLDGLLDAYQRLPYRLRQRYPLVVAGDKGWKSEALHQRFERAAAAGWLKYLGFVAEEDLPLLFSAARLFAFPSYYEGFGLPVLEAMSSGVPVVCSDASSLPEAGGGCALTCAPQDTDALSALLARGLEDRPWREQAIASGRAHASGFCWSRVVNETLPAYRLAASVAGYDAAEN